jgi:hypothetical protein
MDPDGNIYEAHPDDPAEDKARYDGYVRGLVASEGEKAAEIARLRDELARADSFSGVQAFRADLNEHLRRSAQEERDQILDALRCPECGALRGHQAECPIGLGLR